MTQTRIVLAPAITVGDRITELDTPEGPFYDVVKLTAKRITVAMDDGFQTTLPLRATDQLRVAVDA